MAATIAAARATASTAPAAAAATAVTMVSVILGGDLCQLDDFLDAHKTFFSEDGAAYFPMKLVGSETMGAACLVLDDLPGICPADHSQ